MNLGRHPAGTSRLQSDNDAARDDFESTRRTAERWDVSVIPLALAFALIAGWVELAFTVVGPRLFHRLTFTDWHALWIVPTSYLALLAVPAALAELLRQWRPSKTAYWWGVFICAAPCTFGLLWLTYPRLHRLAIVVLSLGLARQIAQWSIRDPAELSRRARVAASVLAAISMASGIATLAFPAGREWWAHRRLPRGESGQPSVILLILDTVRARSLSAYGYERRTSPHLERLASRGVLFEQAFATSSWTFPSHASLFTGRYPYELDADWQRPLGVSFPVLAEQFRNAGYRTGGFAANLYYTSSETGLARGFDHYEDWPLSFTRIVEGSSLGSFLLNNPRVRKTIGFYLPYARKNAERITDDFLAWVQRTDDTGRPYFAFLNILDAHEPYIVPEPYRSMFHPRPGRERQLLFNRRGVAQRPIDERLSEVEIDSEQRAYDGSIAYVDAAVGRLLATLEKRGAMESTLVIVTSDHGELFGEYGLLRHGNSLYPASLQVPLIIAQPGVVPSGRVVPEPVTLRDLPATILSLAGLPRGAIPGSSLEGRWRDEENAEQSPILAELWPAPNQPSWFPVVHGYMRSLTDWPYMLVRRGDGLEELIGLGRARDSLIPFDTARPTVKALGERLGRIPPTIFPGRGTEPTNAPAPRSGSTP